MCRVLGNQRNVNYRQQMSWHVTPFRTVEISKRDYDICGERGRGGKGNCWHSKWECTPGSHAQSSHPDLRDTGSCPTSGNIP